jgi:hypothetical protein
MVDGGKWQQRSLPLGKTLVLFVDGVSGFTVIDGRVFPGASLQVLDADGQLILDEPNLFAQYESSGVSTDACRQLTLSCTTGEPMSSGAEYQFSFKVWDTRGEGQIHATTTMTME